MTEPYLTETVGDRSIVRAEAIVASRRSIDPAAVHSRLVGPVPWSIRAVAETGSTNDDLVAAAEAGGPSDQVLIAELQTAGRGRRDRRWSAPSGSGLTMSVLIEVPEVPAARRGWVSVICALSLLHAVAPHVPNAGLKWPNDLLVGGRKCAGLLAHGTADDRLVLGFGLNVSMTEDELPRPDATSLVLAAAG